jgi:hypothetical protein
VRLTGDLITISASNGGTIELVGAALTYEDGRKQTFNPNGTNAGVNVGSHTADPSSLANGDLWYNSTANQLKMRSNGSTVAIGTGGGGGSGDASTNTSSSVDGEVALFSGTAGKTLKRANGTGYATLANGVLGATTAFIGEAVLHQLGTPDYPNALTIDDELGTINIGDVGSGVNGTYIQIIDGFGTIQMKAPSGFALDGNISLQNGSTITTTGINSHAGSTVTPVNTLTVTSNAAVVNVVKGNNRVTHNANLTLTFSGTPATAYTWFPCEVINSNSGAPIVVTIPSSRSVGKNATVTSFVLAPSASAGLVWLYDGSVYKLYGDPPALDNGAASTAPGVGDDSADGFAPLSLWADTTADNLYLAESVGSGAASWWRLILAHNIDTSAELRGLLGDESGTGAAVFAGGDIGAGTATTASAGDNSTKIATTAFVETRVAGTQTGVHGTPSTTNPLSPTWSGAMHSVWYGATGTINLPAAAGYTGRGILIYNTGAFTITIDPNGSEIVVRDGTAQTGGVNFTLSSGAGNFVALISDGVRWITLGFKGTLTVGS